MGGVKKRKKFVSLRISFSLCLGSRAAVLDISLRLQIKDESRRGAGKRRSVCRQRDSLGLLPSAAGLGSQGTCVEFVPGEKKKNDRSAASVVCLQGGTVGGRLVPAPAKIYIYIYFFPF